MTKHFSTGKKRSSGSAFRPSWLFSTVTFAAISLAFNLASNNPGNAVYAQTPTPPGQLMAAETGGAADFIERKGEGRLFYTTIKVPAGAETLYLSGTGAQRQEDGSCGDMEAQTINTFDRFNATLKAEGWSMSDIIQVRAFAVAGEYGLLDFDGFNRGYTQFFGTEANPQKPVRSFVQVADLVVDCWLVEIEIRAARMPIAD